MLNVAINGQQVQVEEGTTILGAAKKAGISIPTLCFLKGISNIGSCRVCVVEVEGQDSLVASCNTVCTEGMVVTTNSEKAEAARKMNLELLIADHGFESTNYCFSCVKNGDCELQATCRQMGVTESRFKTEQVKKPVFDDNPFLSFNPNLCIKCQRCVGACNNAAGNHTLTTSKKGTMTTIMTPFGADWKNTSCESCGNCAQACPTGALTMKRRREYSAFDVKKTLTTCPHCAIGCQYYLVTKGDKIVDVQAANGPSNKGLLCVKGRSASFDFVQSDQRLTTPLIKNKETGEFEEATWCDALDLVASKFAEIKEQNGGDALAAFACSRSTNEDIYLLQKMARTVFDTNNIDNCARV